MDSGSYSDEKVKGGSEQKRQFGCPCGKTYLSYPALFTHVKQKHNGKAPGKLIKPKKQKPRGRPKIHIDIAENNMSDEEFNLEEEIQKVVVELNIQYSGKIQTLQGNKTCQHMATAFLSELSQIQPQPKKVVHCFLSEVKDTVDNKLGQKYWFEEKPTQIIDLVNEICTGHKNKKDKFPIEQRILEELMFILFRWMYKLKWTDHKLVRKPSQINSK